MANLIRSAKSGSDWTEAELNAYNIKVRIEGEKEFFQSSVDKIPDGLSEDLITYEFIEGEYVPDEKDKILSYLDMASRTLKGQESMVDDFTKELLFYMGYESKGRILRTRHSLGFVICGDTRTAQTDVCIMRRRGGFLLLMQEDKRLISIRDPEPQVIAEAIAAFQENNKIRRNNNIQKLDEMIIPCITMVGTFPRFYLVPVTKELSDCVIDAQYPPNITTILSYIPKIPRRVSDGMKPIENRKKILQCFEAFKKFVDDMEKELL